MRRWQFNAAEEAVVEERMPGEEGDLLRRIFMALGEVAGPIGVEHTGPTKNHAVVRGSVTTSRR